MKTKTYVLTLSTHFPKGHPREGEETDFADRVMRGLQSGGRPDYNSTLPWKMHTIRANYGLWKRRIDEVNAGRAVLSVREWLGAPRRSKQRELFRLDRDSGIGVEMLRLDSMNYVEYTGHPYEHYLVRNDLGVTCNVMADVLSNNDGLSLLDWETWFANPRYDRTKPMAVIHFTNFRYCK